MKLLLFTFFFLTLFQQSIAASTEDRDYWSPNYRDDQDQDLSSLESELETIENQLSTIESDLQSLDSSDTNNEITNNANAQQIVNSNNNNNGGDSVYELDADYREGESNTSPEIVSGGDNSDGYSHVLKHVRRHFLRNNHAGWVILGIAIFAAAISCPCWIACCIGCHYYRKRGEIMAEEKSSYFATSDSDEEKSEKKTVGNSLVRKITTISQKRRQKELRKGTYEPLNALEDDD